MVDSKRQTTEYLSQLQSMLPELARPVRVVPNDLYPHFGSVRPGQERAGAHNSLLWTPCRVKPPEEESASRQMSS